MSGEHPDEADQLRDGTADGDPSKGTKVVADQVPAVHTVKELLEGAVVRASSKEEIDFLTTGHWRLDDITGGFRRSFTWLVGADTSWGKSSFLISVCDENIRAGKKCLIVSSEDAESVYADRLMARRAKISAAALRDRKLERADFDAMSKAAAEAEEVPMFVAANGEEGDGHRSGWPIEDLLKHLSVIVRERNVDFVAFDYLQEFTTKQKFQDERLKFKAIAGLMRRFIRGMKISGCVFSQLTVTGETKVPTRHNIRECRDVANGSDVILIGFEPDADVKDKDGGLLVPAGQKCIHVDKVKNGPRGAKIPMEWNPYSACFKRVLKPASAAVERVAAEHDAPYWQDL
jgi:replicative DNA helicase